MTRLTKAQLLTRIDELEAELGLSIDYVAALTKELDAYHYAQRPSRSEAPKPRTAVAQIADKRAQMAAAKALAMRTGTCVKVA